MFIRDCEYGGESMIWNKARSQPRSATNLCRTWAIRHCVVECHDRLSLASRKFGQDLRAMLVERWGRAQCTLPHDA